MVRDDQFHKRLFHSGKIITETAMLYAKSYCVKMKGYEKTPLPVGGNQIRKLKELFQI